MRYLEIGGVIAFFASCALNIDALQRWFVSWTGFLILGSVLTTSLAVMLLKSLQGLAKTIDRLVKSAFFIVFTFAAPTTVVAAGSILAAAGMLMNELVVLANGMKMPAKLPLWAGIKLPLPELPKGYVYTGPATKLYWLCDRIYCLDSLCSVGDIVLSAGLYIAALGFWLR